jgi:hypothetical protein
MNKPRMLKFIVPDNTGHTVKEFDMNVKSEAAKAQRMFNELRSQGKLLVGTGETGGKFISGEFDPNATEYIVTTRLQGG